MWCLKLVGTPRQYHRQRFALSVVEETAETAIRTRRTYLPAVPPPPPSGVDCSRGSSEGSALPRGAGIPAFNGEQDVRHDLGLRRHEVSANPTLYIRGGYLHTGVAIAPIGKVKSVKPTKKPTYSRRAVCHGNNACVLRQS